MRVAFLPYIGANPYQHLLEKELIKQGIVLEKNASFSLSYLLKNRDMIYHFHWPIHYHKPGFTIKLLLAKLLRIKIVWTVHDLYPHERGPILLERLIRIVLSYASKALIVHCNKAKELVRTEFKKSTDVHVVPHGNYIGYYKDNIDKISAREKLGIKNGSFVYLYFGRIRDYKGIDDLLRAYERNRGKDDTLIIAGPPDRKHIIRKINKYQRKGLSIIAKYCFIPDDEVQLYFSASDVVVLPYKNILTSGTAILGLSFARPIIGPNIGCLPELFASSDIGISYNTKTPNGLGSALTEIKTKDLAILSKNALNLAKDLDWEKAGKRTVLIYKGLI